MVGKITMKEMPMDHWIKKIVGCKGDERLSRKSLAEYQLMCLRETIGHAKKNSPYYGKHYADVDCSNLISFHGFEKIPFIDQMVLKEKGLQLICVPQNEIRRIVTLDTSGSSGTPKRVYFTEEDQELTIDFFHHGMRNIIDQTDRVLILMPHERPGSIGDLLAQGIGRLGAQSVKFGFLSDLTDLPKGAKAIEANKITSIVGTPKQVEKLMNYCKEQENQIKTVLLSAEFVEKKVKDAIEEAWNCSVFEHYGMTEMGLGGAVSCYILEGYHPRENDLYFEIINPLTLDVLPDGEWGEIVFTTLTRKAMPFIRYRTGDMGRWLVEPCPCGSVLKRLDRVGDRGIRKNYENW